MTQKHPKYKQLEKNWHILLTKTQKNIWLIIYLNFCMGEFQNILFCSVYLGKVHGRGGGRCFSSDSYLNPIPLSTFIWRVQRQQKQANKTTNWILNLTWGWRSEQARGESLNKAWPWLHTTLFVPCIINVNSECCTVNTWMDFLEKAALASFSAHVHIYKYIYIYIW